MRWIRYAPLLLSLLLFLLVLPAAARAAGVTIQSFATMADFQASPLYAFAQTGGGPTARRALGVRGVRQGTGVPANSAGAVGNTTVTAEVLSAVTGVPDVFSLNSTSAFYSKKFLTLGTEATAVNPPYLTLDLTPASTAASGGFAGGYDLVVFDLGKNLVDGTGVTSGEATTFQVQLVSEGVFYDVGSINVTEGNFINAILLDVTGLPSDVTYVDAVKITDVSGSGQHASESLDVDGALTLNILDTTAAGSVSWGRIKSLYR